MNEDFWKTVEVRRPHSNKSRRTGVLNIALLFGTAAIALSLIVTPMVSGKTNSPRLAQVPDNLDLITTGSISQPSNGKKSYSIRRSILQKTPGSVCIVEGYGNESGC
jgi:hypothetical protein